MGKIYEMFNKADADRLAEDLTTPENMTKKEKQSAYTYVLQQEKINHKKQNKSGRFQWGSSWQRAAAMIVMVLAITVVGSQVYAAVANYLNDNTKYNYKTEIGETVSGDGVSIEIGEAAMEDETLTIAMSFTFTDDCSALFASMEKWANEEGRDALGHEFFDNSTILYDGKDIQEIDNSILAAGLNVVLEGQTMRMNLEILGVSGDEDHVVDFDFKNFVVDNKTMEGEWQYTCKLDSSSYEDVLETEAINVVGKDAVSTMTLEKYAVTPNGLIIYGKDTNIYHRIATPGVYYKLRILLWDDLGNYYLMYPSHHNLDEDAEENDIVCTLYNDSFAVSCEPGNRNYLTEWAPDASIIYFAIESKVSTEEGQNYTLISDVTEVHLTKE